MKKRSARGKITRESVMDAALAVADRDGFDAVSLRAIAAEVGATPMALYTYFSGKDALYAGMRDRALARATDGRISRRTWQSMLEEMGRGIYRVMREHPHWMPLVAQGSSFPPSGLPLIEELLALMLTDGFVLEDAPCAYGCVMSFAVGSVQFERIMTGAGDVAAKRLAFLKALGRTPGPYANLASVAAKVDRWRWDDVVEFGFESLLTGIEGQVRSTRAPTQRTAARDLSPGGPRDDGNTTAHAPFANRHTVGFLQPRNVYKTALSYTARFDFLG